MRVGRYIVTIEDSEGQDEAAEMATAIEETLRAR
jgi:hypothetical protein